MTHINTNTFLSPQTCISCGIVFYITEEHEKHLKRFDTLFCCPNGHEQHYVNNDKKKIQQLEDEIVKLKKENKLITKDAEFISKLKQQISTEENMNKHLIRLYSLAKNACQKHGVKIPKSSLLDEMTEEEKQLIRKVDGVYKKEKGHGYIFI